MKKYQSIAILVLSCLTFGLHGLSGQDTVRNQQQSAQQQTKQKQQQHFVDADGDGYNDNAPDHDGDGLPNRLDPDWKKLQKKKGKAPFVDMDGDGVNDNLEQENDEQSGQQQMNMKGRDEGGSSVQNQEQNRGKKGKRKGKN